LPVDRDRVVTKLIGLSSNNEQQSNIPGGRSVFLLLLLAVLLAASIHVAMLKERTLPKGGELFLRYILVGYCGVPMVAVSVGVLVSPDRAADILGFPAGNPFQDFLGYAYLGMSLVAVLALRYRGTFLVGPAVGWTVFFAGATAVHLKTMGEGGRMTHGDALYIFAVHGLISVLLAVALVVSGVWKGAGSRERGAV
jgi:hypothetical protein